MRAPKFEVSKDKAGEWRWRLRAANGEIVASSEGYTRRAGAVAGVEACRRNAALATVKVLG